eukprot:264865_1
MSILFFSLLVSLFTYTSSLTTTITPGWVDDFVYSRDDRSDGVNWYDGSWDASDGDLDDSDTFDGVDIHGWYAKTSTENGDKIERRFQCPYYSDVVISFSVYFCYKAGNTPFVYYFRNRIIETEGNAVTFEYNNDNTHQANGQSGTDWATKANGPCGRSAKKATITDEFKLKSNDKFIISVNKELKGNTGEQYSAFAVSITCTQDVTDLPTTHPTSTTATPSTPPTKYPTKFPSQDPSESPSKYPTESPVTAQPSESPITHAPTKPPSKTPTTSPSDSPSNKPTDGPTQKPSKSPTVSQPTDAPTKTSWEDCIDETIQLDAGSIQLFINSDTANKAMQIQLSAPNDVWFGIGFGGNTMNRTTLALTVSMVNGMMRLSPRRLHDHAKGVKLSDALDSIDTTEVGDIRAVTLVKPWAMDGLFDFSDFLSGEQCELPIIWAVGSDKNFAGHGPNYRGSVTLRSCACPTSDPTSDPTSAPTKMPTTVPTGSPIATTDDSFEDVNEDGAYY